MDEFIKIKATVMSSGCDQYDLAKIETALIDAIKLSYAARNAVKAAASESPQVECRLGVVEATR